MPTETKFSTKGLRNGLPFCLEKVDVSGFDYWTTLGGVTKDSPTPTTAKIGESVENASKLFWNLYGVTGSEINGVIDSIDADNDLISGSANPIERICPDVSGNFGAYISTDGATAQNTFLSSKIYGSTCNVVRMYNGSTANESNFVGLGLKSELDTAFSSSSDPSAIRYVLAGAFPDLYLYLGSYGDAVGFPGHDEDYAYVEFEGAWFLVAAVALGDSTQTASAATLTASGDDGGGTPYTITITDIEFYTYT